MLDTKICFLNRHDTENNQFKLHSHNCYEIIYFVAGSGKALINGKSYPVSAGAYCIVPPYAEHVEELCGYGEIMFVGFAYSSPSCEIREGCYYIDEIAKHACFNGIFDEYRNQEPGFQEAAEYLLRMFLLILLRNANANSKKCRDLNYIKTYIEQYADQKINFRELSALGGYSYDYFRHIFKRRFGMSPQEYLIEIRLNNALRLLKTTNLSCTEIAYRCGFSNSPQMTAMFRKRFKETPASFKKADLYKKTHEG